MSGTIYRVYVGAGPFSDSSAVFVPGYRGVSFTLSSTNRMTDPQQRLKKHSTGGVGTKPGLKEGRVVQESEKNHLELSLHRRGSALSR